jgi:hypothetical protein
LRLSRRSRRPRESISGIQLPSSTRPFVRLFLLHHVTVLQKYYLGQEWQAILSIQ